MFSKMHIKIATNKNCTSAKSTIQILHWKEGTYKKGRHKVHLSLIARIRCWNERIKDSFK